MRRQHPFLSSLGFLFTAILLSGLGLVIWRSGGMAFSPGRLSVMAVQDTPLKGFYSHADFETECSRCHAPLQTTQDILCLDCHTDVRTQIETESGAHGSLPAVRQCARCHSDHHGKDFDMLAAAQADIDHQKGGFSLIWHQVNYDASPLACQTCHLGDGSLDVSTPLCVTCHQDHDPGFMVQHVINFGEHCMDCHDGKDQMVKFDHSQTQFPLQGQHASLNCARCHGNQAIRAAEAALQPVALSLAGFQQTPVGCAGCHAEPQAHLGLFGANCETCHSTQGWSPAQWQGKPFEHARLTGFSLARHGRAFSGGPMNCQDCHADRIEAQFDLQVCVNCHAQDSAKSDFMPQHQAKFGSRCLDCHDGVDRMHAFDHASLFPLEGAHARLDCEACHAKQIFKGTPSACVQCHAEPAIHKGFFGLNCQYCHTAQAWTPAPLRMHVFPLNHGGEGDLACKSCHADVYITYTCYGCHDHQPDEIRESHLKLGVPGTDLPDCARCHPSGKRAEAPLPGGVSSQ